MTKRSERAGVLPVDKPEGPTSHDIVALARRALHERRIGHTGTLDPFASGLLLLCIGSATRIAEYMGALPKRYRATVRFGASTDTDDATGTVIARSDAWTALAPDRIEAAFATQIGVLHQRPPAYSAKKIAGERSYKLARKGRAPALDPVEVEVYEMRVMSCDPPDVAFDVACSAGTYIRAIARDVGAVLGVPAHLHALRRSAIGAFRVEDAVPAAALDDAERVARAWVEPLDALAHLPRTSVDADAADRLGHGRKVMAPDPAPAGVLAAEHDGRLVAIVESSDGFLIPRKVFT